MSTPELLGCPCCGASAHWNPKETTLPNGPVTYDLDLGFVECIMGCVRTSGIMARRVAFVKWNTRAAPVVRPIETDPDRIMKVALFDLIKQSHEPRTYGGVLLDAKGNKGWLHFEVRPATLQAALGDTSG